jgi:hypothetical protein
MMVSVDMGYFILYGKWGWVAVAEGTSRELNVMGLGSKMRF